MMDEYTDDELRKELARREEDRERKRLADHNAYCAKLSALITPAAIDVFAPEHDCTTCSDAKLVNGWGSETYGPRCIRCSLLEVLHYGGHYVSYPHRYVLKVE